MQHRMRQEHGKRRRGNARQASTSWRKSGDGKRGARRARGGISAADGRLLNSGVAARGSAIKRAAHQTARVCRSRREWQTAARSGSAKRPLAQAGVAAAQATRRRKIARRLCGAAGVGGDVAKQTRAASRRHRAAARHKTVQAAKACGGGCKISAKCGGGMARRVTVAARNGENLRRRRAKPARSI